MPRRWIYFQQQLNMLNIGFCSKDRRADDNATASALRPHSGYGTFSESELCSDAIASAMAGLLTRRKSAERGESERNIAVGSTALDVKSFTAWLSKVTGDTFDGVSQHADTSRRLQFVISNVATKLQKLGVLSFTQGKAPSAQELYEQGEQIWKSVSVLLTECFSRKRLSVSDVADGNVAARAFLNVLLDEDQFGMTTRDVVRRGLDWNRNCEWAFLEMEKGKHFAESWLVFYSTFMTFGLLMGLKMKLELQFG
jgi:hypothetical protein